MRGCLRLFSRVIHTQLLRGSATCTFGVQGCSCSPGIRFIVSRGDGAAVNRMPGRIGTPGVILLFLALLTVAAVSAVTVYPGSIVTLTGTSTGGDTVYLFVTGPNLPAAGGRLDNPDTPVRSGDPESFTTVAVEGGDRWTYRWRTGDAGLDPGTYTVYAVDAPVDRSNLSGHAYTTIPVTLGTPPETPVAGTAAPTTVMPTEPEKPMVSAATPSPAPSPTSTAAAPVAAAWITAGAVLVAALLIRRR